MLMPALFTRMSILPSSLAARSTAAATEAALETSHWMYTTRAAASAASAATDCATGTPSFRGFTSAMATLRGAGA